MDTETLTDLILHFLDGRMTEVEEGELARLIRETEGGEKLLARIIRIHGGMVTGMREMRQVAQMKSQPEPACVTAEFVPGRSQLCEPSELRQVRWYPRLLAIAAAIPLLLAGGWLLYQAFGPAVPLGLRVVEVQGSGVRVQGAVRSAENIQHPTSNNQQPNGTRVVVGMEIRQGERVVVGKGGKVGLKYDGEETKIELLDASEAGFGAEEGAKRVNLAAGTLVCSAAPQPADRPMLLVTPQAEAKVLGTRFTLAADAEATRIEVTDGLVRMTRATDKASVDVPAGHKATVSNGAEPLVEPMRAQGVLLGLDFEDQKLPEGSTGTIVEGPHMANSRFCVAGVHSKDERLYRVNIRNGSRELLTYREGAVLSFDYWVKEYTGAIDVYFWNKTRSVSRGFVVQTPTQQQWTHVTKRLSDLSKESQDGDLIWDLSIQTTPGGNELFVDNIRIETKDEL